MTEVRRPIGLPAALPAASAANPPQPAYRQGSDRFGAGKSLDSTTVFGSMRGRVGRRQIELTREAMSDRDWAVLRSIAEHRFLTTKHIDALYFSGLSRDASGTRMCRHVLRRLHQQAVISHLDQRVGGSRAGSAAYIWRIGPVGDRLLRFGVDGSGRTRSHDPSPWFRRHCLAIADAHLQLLTASRGGQFDLIKIELEPASWRQYPGLGGEPRLLKPDLSVVTASGEFEDHWNFEVDLGNEHLPTILDKCRAYEAYRRTGLEDEARGVFPIVVWLMHSDERVARVRDAIDNARGLDAGLYRVTTEAGLVELVAGGAA